MSTVKFPAVLRANVGGAREVEATGATIGEVLDSLVGTYPALKDQLFTDDGELNRFVNVYVNGQDVRYLDGTRDAGGRGATRSGCCRRWRAGATLTVRRPVSEGGGRYASIVDADRPYAAGRDPADVPQPGRPPATPSSSSTTRRGP